MKHVLCPKRLWRLLPLLCLLFCWRPVPPSARERKPPDPKPLRPPEKWVVKKGKTRYRYANKTYAKKGFRKINGHWYYFDQNGYVKTGWFSVGKSRYYGNKSSAKGKTGGSIPDGIPSKANLLFLTKSGKGKRGKMLTGWPDH